MRRKLIFIKDKAGYERYLVTLPKRDIELLGWKDSIDIHTDIRKKQIVIKGGEEKSDKERLLKISNELGDEQ